MQAQKPLIIEGWYCIAKEYPDLSRTVLDNKIFKRSARIFDIQSLYITNIYRIKGSFFNPTYVTGVVCTEGSLIPFFIERQKAKKLQEILDSVEDKTSLTL